MTRKLIIKIIAFLYMAQGLWDIGAFFLPIFSTPKPFALNLFTILVGAFGLWAGIYLLRLDEFGRKFAIVLLSLRIMYNSLFIVWAFLQNDFSFAITYFDLPLLVSQSAYAFAVPLVVWILIAFGAVLFLRQRETKMIFVSERASEESSEPLAKTMSNQ